MMPKKLHSKETINVIHAAMALAQRDVDLGLITLAEIRNIPRTRFAPVERKQAVKLLKADGKSDREVAKMLNINRRTVVKDQERSQRRMVHNAPKNGAKAATPAAHAAKDEYDKTAFLHRADLAVSYATYAGKIDKEICRAARAAAIAWNTLVEELEEKNG